MPPLGLVAFGFHRASIARTRAVYSALSEEAVVHVLGMRWL